MRLAVEDDEREPGALLVREARKLAVHDEAKAGILSVRVAVEEEPGDAARDERPKIAQEAGAGVERGADMKTSAWSASG